LHGHIGKHHEGDRGVVAVGLQGIGIAADPVGENKAGLGISGHRKVFANAQPGITVVRIEEGLAAGLQVELAVNAINDLHGVGQ